MSIDELLKKYLTTDKRHFRKIEKQSPIKLSDFVEILKWYLKLNSDTSLTIGEVDKNYKQVGWVFVKDGIKLYRVNGDTTLKGLKSFYNNRNHDLITIPNQKSGKTNKITNDINKLPIEGLYMYND